MEDSDGDEANCEEDRISPEEFEWFNVLLISRQAIIVRGINILSRQFLPSKSSIFLSHLLFLFFVFFGANCFNLEIGHHPPLLLRSRRENNSFAIVLNPFDFEKKFTCVLCEERVVNSFFQCGHACCIKCCVAIIRRELPYV